MLTTQERMCTRCITSVDLLLKNQGLNAAILDEFIYDSLLMSMNHFHLIEETLTMQEKSKYYLTHAQAELLLLILRRLKVNGKYVDVLPDL